MEEDNKIDVSISHDDEKSKKNVELIEEEKSEVNLNSNKNSQLNGDLIDDYDQMEEANVNIMKQMQESNENDPDNINSKLTNGLSNSQHLNGISEQKLNSNDQLDSSNDEKSDYKSLDESFNQDQNLIKNSDEDSKQESNQESNNQSTAESDKFSELFDNPDLLKKILRAGDETTLKPERGCEVLINLQVRNAETNDTILSECQDNLTVIVGDFDVIHGVDLALVTMHKGEIAEILIKPKVGYGPLGKSEITATTNLLCKVELLKATWPVDMKCACLEDLLHYFDLSKFKKERGNFFFKREDYVTALHCYTKSGEFLDFVGEEMVNRHHMLVDLKGKVDDEAHKKEIDQELDAMNTLSLDFMKLKLDVFNNQSAVNIKRKSYNQAMVAVDGALSVNPDHLKALFRKSTILAHKGQIEESIIYLKKAIKIEPKNKVFQKELKNLTAKLKNEYRQEKDLYAKMLQEKPNKSTKSDKESTSFDYLTAGLVVSGLALTSYVIYRKYFKT